MTDLAKLRELEAAATKGPWHHCLAFQTVPASRTVHGSVPAQRVGLRHPFPHRNSCACCVGVAGRMSAIFILKVAGALVVIGAVVVVAVAVAAIILVNSGRA